MDAVRGSSRASRAGPGSPLAGSPALSRNARTVVQDLLLILIYLAIASAVVGSGT